MGVAGPHRREDRSSRENCEPPDLSNRRIVQPQDGHASGMYCKRRAKGRSRRPRGRYKCEAAAGRETSLTTSTRSCSDARRARSACETMPQQQPCSSTTTIRRI